ncbi:hypothetical protein E5675_07385 [Sphingopyxis sp. PAMC25046]|uniref:DUF6941 family protein n=1 Tax=Sphingopyxis sp. PAMC25046 TaxID=2565556 RepID=UPI00109E280A|nr:hypothetical protein [Sphingopyxis sp. PAMC25046]QCB54273.1 hypothetical protein E5675_07385 [Sphingopyxis sp. PAMC25046]
MFLKVFTVAETVVVDARTNRASIVNVSEEYQTPSFPFIAGNLTAVVMIEREDNDDDEKAAKLEIRCGNELTLQGSFAIQFSGLVRTRAIIEIGNFTVNECEQIHFDIMIDDERFARWTVGVRVVEDASEATPQPV